MHKNSMKLFLKFTLGYKTNFYRISDRERLVGVYGMPMMMVELICAGVNIHRENY